MDIFYYGCQMGFACLGTALSQLVSVQTVLGNLIFHGAAHQWLTCL